MIICVHTKWGAQLHWSTADDDFIEVCYSDHCNLSTIDAMTFNTIKSMCGPAGVRSAEISTYLEKMFGSPNT